MPVSEYRRCRRCGEDRPPEDFRPHKGSKDGLGYMCEGCHKTGWAHRAKGLLSHAVARGEVVRPAACDSCGEESDGIEAHHHDYSKPLEVVWLCRGCHRKTHSGLPTLTDDRSRAYYAVKNRERREQIRTWAIDNADPCETCGAPLEPRRRRDRAARCRWCADKDARLQMRRRFFAAYRLRRQGKRNVEIAKELEMTPEAVAIMLQAKRCEEFGVDHVVSPHYKRN